MKQGKLYNNNSLVREQNDIDSAHSFKIAECESSGTFTNKAAEPVIAEFFHARHKFSKKNLSKRIERKMNNSTREMLKKL